MKIKPLFWVMLLSNVTLFAAEPAVVQQLRGDLMGKQFQLQIDVAGSTCLYDPALSRPTSRLVDTELMEDGSVRYFLRADRFMNIRQCARSMGSVGDTTFGGTYVEPRFVAVMHRAGEQVTVNKVEGKNDRVEIQITAGNWGAGDEAYGKIKLMTDGAHPGWTLQEMEQAVSRALYLPRIHDIESATSALQSIQGSIATAEHQLGTSKDAEVLAPTAVALATLYNDETTALGRVNQVAFTPLPPAKHPYTLEELRKIQLQAEGQLEQQRRDSIAKAYAEAAMAMKSACGQLPAPDDAVTTREQLARQIRAADKLNRKLSTFNSARSQMLSNGQSISEEDEAEAKKCDDSSNELSATFPAKKQKIVEVEAAIAEAERERMAKLAEVQQQKETAEQIATLNNDYKQLSKERSTLDAKLVEALAENNQGQVFYEYRVLLGRMISNRQEALSLGYGAAEAQIRALNDQLQKLH